MPPQEFICMWKIESLCTLGGNVKWLRYYENQYGDALKKSNINLPYDPAIPLLDLYLKELKAGFPEGICTLMFILPLFPRVKM